MGNKKKDTTQRNVIIVVIVMIALALFVIYGNSGTLFTAATNPGIPEPINIKQCSFLDGVCVPVQQDNKGLVEFGRCSSSTKCLLEENCMSSGGRYVFNPTEIGNRVVFEKICECPKPLRFDVTEGCRQVFE